MSTRLPPPGGTVTFGVPPEGAVVGGAVEAGAVVAGAVVAGAEFGHAGGDDDAAAVCMFQAVEQVEGVGRP